jgi:hypothetical protein
MHPKTIRPIRFDRDCPKAFLLDQPPRQLRTRGVKLVGAVACFPKQNKLRRACDLDQRIVLAIGGKRARRRADCRRICLKRGTAHPPKNRLPHPERFSLPP